MHIIVAFTGVLSDICTYQKKGRYITWYYILM
nr:MAG TPA: hypothetical protein [Caudoviricetes sp.]